MLSTLFSKSKLAITVSGNFSGRNGQDQIVSSLTKVKEIGTVVGVATLITAVLFLIIFAVKLAKSGSSVEKRSKAIQGIIYSLIGAMLAGGTWTIVAQFSGALK